LKLPMTMSNISEKEAKQLIIDTGKKMYERGFVASNDGNISIRVADGVIMTPNGVSKGAMTEDMLVKVDLDGRVMAGTYRISTETAMHLRIYREDPNVGAVVHAHPPAAVAHAIARIPLDCRLYPEAMVNLGSVPVAPYATPGTSEVPDSVASFVKNGYRGVLLANHGPVCWGRDIREAWFRLEALEGFAKILINLRLLGGGVALREEEIAKLGLKLPTEV